MPTVDLRPNQPEDGTVGAAQLAANAVDLDTSATAGTVTITNTAGNDATLNAAAASTGGSGGEAGLITAQCQEKIDNIAENATANAADAYLLARENHTGSQLASTISDFVTASYSEVTDILIAGANITLTPNGTTIQIAASGSLTATLDDGDYGDITVSGSGTVLSIDAGVVGNTELATDAVTTANIADDAVDLDKVHADVLARANHTGTIASTDVSDFTEAAQDAVGAIMTNGTGITCTYDDGAGTITVSGHTHANSAVLNSITEAGSGSIISSAERTAIGTNTTAVGAAQVDATQALADAAAAQADADTGIANAATAQGDADTANGVASTNATAIGASGAAHLGTFSGTTITDSRTVKQAFQEIETALEAVDTAAVDALEAFVGITPAALGLVGDGDADDTGALQDLLDAGGTIHLPEGTFKVVWSTAAQGLLMALPGTRLIGRGMGKTTIRFVPATSPTNSTSYGLRVYTDTVTIPDNCTIEGITFESTANVAEGKIVNMVEARGADYFTMRDCDIISTDSISTYTVHDGYLHGNQGPTIPLTLYDCDYTLLENVRCRDSCGEEWNTAGAYGLSVDSCQNLRAFACTFTNNYFDGVKCFDTEGRIRDITFVACEASNNGQTVANAVVEDGTGNIGNGNGFDLDGSSIRCIGCTADYNYGAGFQAKGDNLSDIVFESCTARYNRTSGTDKQAGFSVFEGSALYLTNSSTAVMGVNNVRIVNCESIENDGIGIDINKGIQCQVRGNTVRSNGTIGIRLHDDAVRCIVSENHVMGNGRTDATSTAYGIHLNGGGNVVRGNWISGIDTLREGDEDQVDYRTRTPYTDRGIQINAGTGAECNFCFQNIIEEMAASLYIQRSSGEVVLLGNYQADGTVITDGHFGP